MAWKQSTNMVAPLLFPVMHMQTQTLLLSIVQSPDCYVCTPWPSVTSLPKQTLSYVPRLHLSGTAPLNPSLFSPDTHFNLHFFLFTFNTACPARLVIFGGKVLAKAEARIIDSSMHCMILFSNWILIQKIFKIDFFFLHCNEAPILWGHCKCHPTVILVLRPHWDQAAL